MFIWPLLLHNKWTSLHVDWRIDYLREISVADPQEVLFFQKILRYLILAFKNFLRRILHWLLVISACSVFFRYFVQSSSGLLAMCPHQKIAAFCKQVMPAISILKYKLPCRLKCRVNPWRPRKAEVCCSSLVIQIFIAVLNRATYQAAKPSSSSKAPVPFFEW